MTPDTPEEFLKIIPATIPENIEFRKRLTEELLADKGYRSLFAQMCMACPQIAFNSIFWTFNPRLRVGYRNIPMILRPAQFEAVSAIKDAIDTGSNTLVDKSRDEGATEIITKIYIVYFLFEPESMFLVGSRKEEYVDKGGDHKCLFAKIDYTISHMPICLQPNIERTHMHIANLDNGSGVDGESTNENFGAGDRRLSVMVDEHGRIKHNLAQSIIENLSDTTDCTIINSTHFYGAGHPFNKLKIKGLATGFPKVIVLPWERNPEKNQGLYRSPELNVIEVKDIDYYRTNYPGCFDNIESMQPFKLSEFELDLIGKSEFPEISFIADGGEVNSGGWRSPWYDQQEKERSSRDVAQNIDRNPIGAGDMFFDGRICKRVRDETVRPSKCKGEVEFDYDKNQKIRNARFVPEGGKSRFKWWGSLRGNRPDQSHNYIVGCDISLGTGASNSVASVYDVNSKDKIGTFVCPNSPPESFADQTIAICKWVGGVVSPFLIWEANGPGGSFDKRVRWHGYNNVYSYTAERVRGRPRTKKNGWYSSADSKYDLLLELRIAINEGLKTQPRHKSLKIYDEKTVGEYEDYIFYENGDIGLSECVDDDSGARKSHGDRVIPDGLYVLALSEQKKAASKEQARVRVGSPMWRRQQYLSKKKKNRWSD